MRRPNPAASRGPSSIRTAHPPLASTGAALALSALHLVGCSSPSPSLTPGTARPLAATRSADADGPWSAPPLEHAVSIRDGRTGERLTLTQLLDDLATREVVFLGETHTDETTHRVELAVYAGLLERLDEKVVLALEMFERDVQGSLDDYTSAEIDEAAFRESARPWNNYDTAYRPLVELARRKASPVVASNFPAPLRRRIAFEGTGVLDEVRAGEPHLVPERLEPTGDAYWRRVDNAVRGHLEMMGPRGPEDRLTSTQSLWDNCMAESCERALDAWPGHVVLHVNGGFHSAYWDGTVHQLVQRRRDTRIATVSIVPTHNPGVAELSGPPVADFVVFAEARASDRNEGKYGVWVQRELKYAFELPAAASSEAPVPLLIWLGDDGLVARDGLALWRDRIGAECALAVLDPPYRETSYDLATAGRWAWPDTFSADVSTCATAVERVASFLVRHYPIDPERIVLAGEGAGATVAATTALLSERLGLEVLAFAPTHYQKVKDLPLPLAEYRAEGARPSELSLVLEERSAEWWAKELEQYDAAGLAASARSVTQDPWDVEPERERTVRAALGLPASPGEAGAKRHIVAAPGRAHFWARLRAVAHARETGESVAVVTDPSDPRLAGSTAIDLGVDPASFDEEHPPPRAPGPFGGTTVIVLADDDPQYLAAWERLETEDPLAAKSRFHRTRIATEGSERSLAAVLGQLADEGRHNVLVVPATFCADGARMRALEALAGPVAGDLTLHWLPGLGGPR